MAEMQNAGIPAAQYVYATFLRYFIVFKIVLCSSFTLQEIRLFSHDISSISLRMYISVLIRPAHLYNDYNYDKREYI